MNPFNPLNRFYLAREQFIAALTAIHASDSDGDNAMDPLELQHLFHAIQQNLQACQQTYGVERLSVMLNNSVHATIATSDKRP